MIRKLAVPVAAALASLTFALVAAGSTVTPTETTANVGVQSGHDGVSMPYVAAIDSAHGLSVSGLEVVPALGEVLVPQQNDAFATSSGDPSFPGKLQVVSLRTNRVVKTLDVGYQPDQTVYDARDNRVFVANFAGYAATNPHRNIQVFNAKTWKLEATLVEPYTHVANSNWGIMILDTRQDELYALMGNEFDVISAKSLRRVKIWHQGDGDGMAIDEATQTFYGADYQGAVWTANLRTLKVASSEIGVGHGGCYNDECAGGQPSGTDGITLDSANDLLYAANANDGDLVVVNTKTRRAVSVIEPGVGEGTFMTVIDQKADLIYALNDGEQYDTGITVIDGRSHKILDNLLYYGNAAVTVDLDAATHRLYVGLDPTWANTTEPQAKSEVAVYDTCSADEWVARAHGVAGITKGC